MKVMFFQDGPDLDEGIAEALQRAGCRPQVHTDFGTGAEAFSRESPRLAVVDARRGEAAAVSLLRGVRGRARASGASVVALCGDWEQARRLLEAGADDCLHDPVRPSELVFRLGLAWGREAERRRIWEAGKAGAKPPAVSRLFRENTGESLVWFRPDDRTLFERMPVGLYRSTPDGKILDANAALVKIMGASDRAQMLASPAIDRYVDPEDRRRWKELIRKEGVVKDFEVRLRRHDGRVIWVKLSGQAFFGPDGEARYYEGSLEDVTDQKAAEEALRKSEERFRSLVQNSSDMIALLDAQGMVLYESPAHERFLGHPAVARVGRTAMELVHPDDLEKAGALLKELLEDPSRTVSGEFRLRHADGSWRVIACTGTNLLHNPAVEGVVVNSHDITQRHNAEEALRKSEERFRSLVQNASDLVSIVDSRGRILYASPPHQRLLGYDPAATRGVRLADLLYPKDWVRVRQLLARLAETPGAVVTFEARVRNRAGDWKVLHTTGTNLIGNSAVGGIVLNSHDITQSKQAEEALRESEERFRHLATAAFEGIVIHDGERIVEANRTAAELFGYALEEIIGLARADLVAPEYRDFVARRQVDSVPMEALGSRKDGSLFPIEWVERAIPFRGGSMRVAAIRDLTERRRAERELRESQEKHANLFRYSNDAILVHGLDGLILDVNERALEQFERERGEIVGIHVQSLPAPEHRQQFQRNIESLLESGFVRFEIDFKNRRGRRFTAEVSASLFQIGGRRVAQEIVRDVTERKRSEQAIRESEALYRGLFEGVPLGLYRISRDGRLVDVNMNLVRLLGHPDRESLLGTSTTDLYVHDDDRLEWQRQMEREGSVRDFECPIRRHGGGVIWVRSSATAIQDAAGRVVHYEGAVQDITDRKEAVEALRQKEERFQSLVQHAPDMIAILDRQGKILYESPAYERVLGRTPAQRIGNSAFDFVHPEDLDNLRAALEELLQEPGRTLTVEHRASHADGSWRVLEATATNLLENASVRGIVVNSRDVTERKRALDQLLHGALYDPLTGLPNRALLIDRLERAVTASRQRPHRNFAVLFLDLDQFKIINDSLGHTIGDRLLVQIGLALKTVLRPVDTIARLGGDEFVMLLDDVREEQHAIRVAERVHEILKTPFHIGGHEIFTTTSIGVAFNRPNATGPEDLLRDADTAMYRAKAQGRACHVVFDPTMHETALNWLRLETDLRRAVNNDEFSVLYQPILSLPERDLVGFEALARWNHPDRGRIPPAEFIPVAEETGLIIPLGKFVLRRACADFGEWSGSGSIGGPLTVSVNLSNRQFFHAELLDDLERILQESGLDPDRLALEITEGVLVQDAELAARRFEQLKRLGLKLFLDDFGTGYSSLSYLHRFPIDTLKIDRSFVAQLRRGAENREIVQAILTLGESLGVRVVAEGVETPEQAAELTHLGCRLCQGYFFSRPMEPAQAADFVRDWRAARRAG